MQSFERSGNSEVEMRLDEAAAILFDLQILHFLAASEENTLNTSVSRPVVSLGIFSVVPPTEPCALRSIQPLKVSTRDFSWGKGGRCFKLTTYHPCSAETSINSGPLTTRNPLSHLGLSRETFTSVSRSFITVEV